MSIVIIVCEFIAIFAPTLDLGVFREMQNIRNIWCGIGQALVNMQAQLQVVSTKIT